jgi:hypothetical protein
MKSTEYSMLPQNLGSIAKLMRKDFILNYIIDFLLLHQSSDSKLLLHAVFLFKNS